MHHVARDLPTEFWQAPVPSPALEVDEVPADLPQVAACPGCATEFMVDSRFCYTCGIKRPQPLLQPHTHQHFRSLAMEAATRFRFYAGRSAATARKNISALPALLSTLNLSALKRQTGLGTASLAAFAVGIVCSGTAVVQAFAGAGETGTQMLALHLQRIEWLAGATAAFTAGLLLKHPKSSD